MLIQDEQLVAVVELRVFILDLKLLVVDQVVHEYFRAVLELEGKKEAIYSNFMHFPLKVDHERFPIRAFLVIGISLSI